MPRITRRGAQTHISARHALTTWHSDTFCGSIISYYLLLYSVYSVCINVLCKIQILPSYPIIVFLISQKLGSEQILWFSNQTSFGLFSVLVKCRQKNVFPCFTSQPLRSERRRPNPKRACVQRICRYRTLFRRMLASNKFRGVLASNRSLS